MRMQMLIILIYIKSKASVYPAENNGELTWINRIGGRLINSNFASIMP